MMKKRIFNIKVANFLISNGAELVEIRTGEVQNRPERQTFLFKNDVKLSEALMSYKTNSHA
ncbi:DUF5659 domain-containing protein [Priestia megaterium]|uniref:DUF5659 domain-containing protein n=1 Tax=Priestia megaterium TaxID=1404 RepID=UPI00285C4A6E|nr:DUF5659 domain-containing protein [Priestia megaterium]MDR7244237.1 hypothetical protein [Priestia megaterium]